VLARLTLRAIGLCCRERDSRRNDPGTGARSGIRVPAPAAPQDAIPGLTLNGLPTANQNTLNLTFPGVSGESLLMALDLAGVEVSMGSACAAGAVEPSHVLVAMGRTAPRRAVSIRLSLGWSTTAEEIETAAEIIPRIWRRVAAAEPAPAEVRA